MNHIYRCERCLRHPEYIRYHDEERGVPLHDEAKHFEMLVLETMQAWLSWWTILQRREAYRKAFASFDPQRVARFTSAKVESLMQDSSIIRNRAKIQWAITNAKKFLEIQKEYGSFDAYIWWFTKGMVVDNHICTTSDIAVTSPLSDMISRDMKKRGFSFVGSITIYAHLQAIGVINDHSTKCFRYKEVKL